MAWVWFLSVATALVVVNIQPAISWYRHRKEPPYTKYDQTRALKIRRQLMKLGVDPVVAREEGITRATKYIEPGLFPRREILARSGACVAGAIIGAIMA